MQFLDIGDKQFGAQFDAILSRSEQSGKEVEHVVVDIIAAVRNRGDDALLEYTVGSTGWSRSRWQRSK